jgi:hypothetical protein
MTTAEVLKTPRPFAMPAYHEYGADALTLDEDPLWIHRDGRT